MTVKEWAGLVFMSACAACGAGHATSTKTTLRPAASVQAPGSADTFNVNRPLCDGGRDGGSGLTDDVTFDLSSDPHFASYEAVVREYVRRSGIKRASDVCVVGFVHADQSRSAWVVWLEGDRIVLWEEGDGGLDRSRRTLDLTADVVATEDDVHGSTYLVTRVWVSDLTATCARAGRAVHVPGRGAR